MFSVKKIAIVVFSLTVVLFNTSAFASDYTVDIIISGLEASDLSALDIDVAFDDSVLSVASYTLTEVLGSFDDFEAGNWSWEEYQNGTFNLAVVSFINSTEAGYENFFNSQSDSFILASINFSGSDSDADDAIAGITLSYVDLADESGNPITFSVNGTSITASAVPEPSTLSLMALGLMGMIGLTRKSCRL